MLVVTNLKYASPSTILFQRLSVITVDFLFYLSALWFCVTYYKNAHGVQRGRGSKQKQTLQSTFDEEKVSSVFKEHFQNGGLAQLILVITVLNPGLIIVDSIQSILSSIPSSLFFSYFILLPTLSHRYRLFSSHIESCNQLTHFIYSLSIQWRSNCTTTDFTDIDIEGMLPLLSLLFNPFCLLIIRDNTSWVGQCSQYYSTLNTYPPLSTLLMLFVIYFSSSFVFLSFLSC